MNWADWYITDKNFSKWFFPDDYLVKTRYQKIRIFEKITHSMYDIKIQWIGFFAKNTVPFIKPPPVLESVKESIYRY